MFGARFDDMVTGESFSLVEPVEELVARSPDEVVAVIDHVAQASRDGQWVAGYLAYEAAPAFDAALTTARHTDGPVAWFGVFRDAVSVERPRTNGSVPGAYTLSTWLPSVDADDYRHAFGAVRDHIEQGDTYQVNVTFPLSAAFNGDPEALYADLVAAQLPGYASHIWHGDDHILSSSPERFFAIEGRRIVTTPMKGTARRGRWAEEDRAIQQRLEASSKDRAENLMIVDLIRNDLGRVAEFGSVEVQDLFSVERFPTVWQMTSTIAAELRDDVALADVFGALFPCGSVTGAPKASSMAIIADVEKAPRGVYCGTVGFIPPGDGRTGASFNVAIRTVQVDAAEGVASYGVGGGVTWYSDANAEYEEALTKALVLHRPTAVDGLIETIRWEPATGWVLLDAHMTRLADSAAYYDIEVDPEAVHMLLDSAVDGRSAPTRVRLSIGHDELEVMVADAPHSFATGPHSVSSDVVTLAIDPEPVDAADHALFHKTTSRDQYDRRMARHPYVDDVVLVNTEGRVTETCIANIAVLDGGAWKTPPIEDGLLAGIMRGDLLARGVLGEGSITVDELRGADAIAVFNSVRGWQPAVLTTT